MVLLDAGDHSARQLKVVRIRARRHFSFNRLDFVEQLGRLSPLSRRQILQRRSIERGLSLVAIRPAVSVRSLRGPTSYAHQVNSAKSARSSYNDALRSIYGVSLGIKVQGGHDDPQRNRLARVSQPVGGHQFCQDLVACFQLVLQQIPLPGRFDLSPLALAC